jgi:hypothetical protein
MRNIIKNQVKKSIKKRIIMKRKFFVIIFIYTILFNSKLIIAQETEKLLLNDIIENINNYKSKTLTLKLRFKNLDTNFDKIVFYDRKNTDIVFDIAEIKKTNFFKKQRLNLHEGLEYFVTFTIKDLSERKNVSGDLKEFQPVLLSKLPY